MLLPLRNIEIEKIYIGGGDVLRDKKLPRVAFWLSKIDYVGDVDYLDRANLY